MGFSRVATATDHPSDTNSTISEPVPLVYLFTCEAGYSP